MAKRKDSIALFEAMSKTRDARAHEGPAVPNWFNKQNGAAADPASPAPETAAPRPVASATANEKVKRALSPRNPIVIGAAVGLVVILIVAFAIGQFAGKNTGGPVKPDPTKAPPPVKTGFGDPVKPKTKYYLVIQGMAGAGDKDLADCDKIVEWLKTRNEPAQAVKLTVKPTGRQYYAVLSSRPFENIYVGENKRSAESDKFARDIEKLGQQYKKDNGRYWFNQQNKGKFDPYFVTPP